MNCETLQAYLDRYSPLVADRARAAFEPLHVPATDPVVELDLKRPMLPAQAHVVTAAVKTLHGQKSVFIAADCGTGKTQIGACTVHAHAQEKPYRAIVMCPPHLVEVWRKELQAIFPAEAVDLWTLDRWNELLIFPRGRLTRPLWLIVSETTAKMGPGWRPAAVRDRNGILRCPDCGAQLRRKAGGAGDFLALADLKKSRKRCTAEFVGVDAAGRPTVRTCGAALWQCLTDDRVWPPADYIHKRMAGVFDYLICDELHQEKSETSARANALGALAASVKKVIGLTGTLIGGKAGHIRSLLFRLAPKSLRAEDLAWNDAMEFASRYGRIDTITVEKEASGDDNRRSRGKSRTTRLVEQPGIMPTLYGRHLIGNTIFLSLEDVAADLPPYRELPTPVTMGPELGEPYRELEEKLTKAVKELLKKGNHQLLSTMLHALLAYPDYPYDWPLIGYTDHKIPPHGRFVAVAAAPTLDRRGLWPKEKKLLEILLDQRAQGRQSWVFATYTDKHPVLERLRQVVTAAGLRAKVLHAEQVPTRSRSAWIAQHAPAVDVMISHPQPVGTGLTLFDPQGRHNFSTLIFYETGYDIFALRQASRRSWRIGQRQPCDVHFLYYAATMQARAMDLMARKLEASLALEGQFSAEGLAAMAGDGGSLAMELAKSLVENIDFGNAERTWAKLSAKPEPVGRLSDDEVARQLGLFA